MHKSILPILLLASFGVRAAEPNCRDPQTTYDLNMCGQQDIVRLEGEMRRYFDAAKARMEKEVPDAVASLIEAQESWSSFTDKHCQAIYLRWEGGTIRGPMSVRCRIDAIKSRTRQLWSNYLTYPDSTPPILPEPNGQ